MIFIFCFLPLTLALYFFRPSINYRNSVLLVTSVLFYIWGELWNVWIISLTVFVSYIFALSLSKEDHHPRRQIKLSMGIGLILIILIYFKYAGFLIDLVNHILPLNFSIPVVVTTIPLGISFFSFHAISYLIDVFHNRVRAEKRPHVVALYFFLFPHQIAGPIVRYQLFASQVFQRSQTLEDFAQGIERFIIGLAKKVLIANSVASTADVVFGLPTHHLSTALAWYGILSYALQIYFDFSGYSDMAIGLARVFGIHFHENFNYPYRSLSVTEFWRRWHISLSSWFRDYLYIPLGGNRHSPLRTYLNLLVVFFFCGLWHGASATFIVWGIWHGLFLVFERLGISKILKKIKILGFFWTLLVVLCGWVFFRADSLSSSFAFLKTMFDGCVGGEEAHYQLALLFSNQVANLGFLSGLIFSSGHVAQWIRRPRSSYIYNCSLLLLFILTLSRLADGTFNPFIYFRF